MVTPGIELPSCTKPRQPTNYLCLFSVSDHSFTVVYTDPDVTPDDLQLSARDLNMGGPIGVHRNCSRNRVFEERGGGRGRG